VQDEGDEEDEEVHEDSESIRAVVGHLVSVLFY
jgi:hypothetical protein